MSKNLFLRVRSELSTCCPCVSSDKPERAEGGLEETVVPAVGQEETQVDQQGPGAAERLCGR